MTGQIPHPFGETSEALFLTQGFIYESAESAEARFLNEEPGYSYTRYSNPTTTMFEERMASLEGAEMGQATATGMAAVTAAMMGQVKAGDHVVAARALFGSCRWVVEDLLPRFGVGCTLVDGPNLDEWQAAVTPATKAFLLETPSNPSLEIIDIAGVAEIAHAAGATLTVDNVFASPLFQRPLALGADCVVYSATKHIDGQGRCLGGIILASVEFIETHVQQFLRMTGPTISPFNAWVLLKGLETLPIRVERQTETAGYLADFLAGHPKVQRLDLSGPRRPPAGGADPPPDDRRLDHDRRRGEGRQGGRVPVHERPAADPHLQQSRRRQEPGHPSVDHDSPALFARPAPQMGIRDGLVRFSVGLEHRDDLLSDLDQALAQV